MFFSAPCSFLFSGAEWPCGKSALCAHWRRREGKVRTILIYKCFPLQQTEHRSWYLLNLVLCRTLGGNQRQDFWNLLSLWHPLLMDHGPMDHGPLLMDHWLGLVLLVVAFTTVAAGFASLLFRQRYRLPIVDFSPHWLHQRYRLPIVAIVWNEVDLIIASLFCTSPNCSAKLTKNIGIQ